MRVAITGGSGYIGTRFLVAWLAEARDPDEVVVIDLKEPSVADPRVRFVRRSVTQPLADVLADRARPVDAALHLAWCVDPLRDPAKQREVCVGGTHRFLDGCSAGRVPHVLFMSSATAYGANPAHAEPVPEYEPLKPEWHFQYSAEKREGEELCRRFAADRPGTLLQIVRPSIVGGPNVSNFIFRGLDRPVSFLGLGHDPHMQFVHEEDVAGALLAILKSKIPGAFNVAGDGTLRVSEAYQLLGARRVLELPVAALRATLAAAWRFDLRSISEAPADSLWFFVYPWLVSNRRLKEEVGYKLRFTSREVLEDFRAAKMGRPARPARTPVR